MMKINKIPKMSSELEILPYRIENDKVFVKYYNEGVQAGFPSPADDFKEHKISLDKKYLNKPDSTFLIKVKGDSMSPTLQMGDILIVRSDLRFGNNMIGIISINNTDFTVKRFDKKNKCFIADNKNFPKIKIEEEDTLLCLGVVKQLIRDL